MALRAGGERSSLNTWREALTAVSVELCAGLGATLCPLDDLAAWQRAIDHGVPFRRPHPI
jgi:hypothetical protein